MGKGYWQVRTRGWARMTPDDIPLPSTRGNAFWVFRILQKSIRIGCLMCRELQQQHSSALLSTTVENTPIGRLGLLAANCTERDIKEPVGQTGTGEEECFWAPWFEAESSTICLPISSGTGSSPSLPLLTPFQPHRHQLSSRLSHFLPRAIWAICTCCRPLCCNVLLQVSVWLPLSFVLSKSLTFSGTLTPCLKLQPSPRPPASFVSTVLIIFLHSLFRFVCLLSVSRLQNVNFLRAEISVYLVHCYIPRTQILALKIFLKSMKPMKTSFTKHILCD